MGYKKTYWYLILLGVFIVFAIGELYIMGAIGPIFKAMYKTVKDVFN